MKIYTKTGDSGETGLLGGTRVRKDAVRIAAYGTVDELNTVLGVVRAESLPDELDAVLRRIQNELFELGAQLATPQPGEPRATGITEAEIRWQEETIDRLESRLEPLHQFILPAGCRSAALLHLARCTCRRAEREVVTLASQEPLSPHLVPYLNRLSDLLFVLARRANALAGVADVPWEKRQA